MMLPLAFSNIPRPWVGVSCRLLCPADYVGARPRSSSLVRRGWGWGGRRGWKGTPGKAPLWSSRRLGTHQWDVVEALAPRRWLWSLGQRLAQEAPGCLRQQPGLFESQPVWVEQGRAATATPVVSLVIPPPGAHSAASESQARRDGIGGFLQSPHLTAGETEAWGVCAFSLRPSVS